MTLIVKVDDDKAAFVEELLGHLDFVHVQATSDSDEDIIRHVEEGVKEINEILAGRSQARPLEDLLREL